MTRVSHRRQLSTQLRTGTAGWMRPLAPAVSPRSQPTWPACWLSLSGDFWHQNLPDQLSDETPGPHARRQAADICEAAEEKPESAVSTA